VIVIPLSIENQVKKDGSIHFLKLRFSNRCSCI